jgi:hypothetical protein
LPRGSMPDLFAGALPELPADRSEIVYFIQAESGGPVKIGKSTRPENRLRQLQTSHPVKLLLLAKPTDLQAIRVVVLASSEDRNRGHPTITNRVIRA